VEVRPDEVERRVSPAISEERRTPARVRVESGASDVSTDVDLRGLTFEEAADIVDKYLDDLFLARMPRATLIHGKGTGALRQKLGEFLRTHPRVKAQRLGGHNEGGSGVTVVELDVDG
jgi:DNA mismatch repair protein MutS2